MWNFLYHFVLFIDISWHKNNLKPYFSQLTDVKYLYYIFDITYDIWSIIAWNNVREIVEQSEFSWLSMTINSPRRHVDPIDTSWLRNTSFTQKSEASSVARNVLVLTTLVFLGNRVDEWFYKAERELSVSSRAPFFFLNARDMTHTRLSVKIIDNSGCRAHQIASHRYRY